MQKNKGNRNSPAPVGQSPNQTGAVFHQQITHETILSPQVLERYQALMPDAPERVLRQFELNSESERLMREQAMAQSREINLWVAKDNRRRDWIVFAIVIAGFSLSAFFAYIQVFWLSGGVVAAILVAAIKGYLDQKKSSNSPPP